MESAEQINMLKTTLPIAEILIIKRDVDLIKKLSLMQGKLRAYFGLYFMPYVALVCYEALSYMEKKGYAVDLNQTSKYSIKDIRNKAKFFDLRFNQVLQSASNVDLLQHDYFARNMKYPELAAWNIHDNLGIYFDAEKKVIGNTQYPVWVFQDENMIKKPIADVSGFDVQSKETEAFGFDLGRIIGSVSEGFSSVNDFIESDVSSSAIDVYGNDFNTNRCWSDTAEKYKPVRLLLLHVLSSIGFLLGIVKRCIIRDSGLLVRLEYIIYNSALKRFRQLNEYIKNSSNELCDDNLLRFMSNVDFDDNVLRSDQFGNCMRHYGLVNKDGNSMISATNFNLALPLCGLVESTFNIDYYEYRAELESKLLGLYDGLFEYLGLNGLLSISNDMLKDDYNKF